MSGTFFYIGLGLGLAGACGLRPYLPALLAGALARVKVLGVGFASSGHFQFLARGWWLLAVAVVLAATYAVQVVLGDERYHALAVGAVAAQAVAVGALLFAGTFAQHGDAWWPGLLGGALAAGLAERAAGPVIAGARTRLDDGAARIALSVYLDAAALLVAALAAALHPLGYIFVAALAWFVLRRRARAAEKYAGLRVLRR